MSAVREFAINLARGHHSAKEILEEMHKTFGEDSLKFSQVYKIIRYVHEEKDMEDRRGKNLTMRVRTPELIESARRFVESDRRATYLDIQEAFQLTPPVVHALLHQDLELVKKSARWVPRLLTPDQKKKKSGIVSPLFGPPGVGSILDIQDYYHG